MSDTYRVVVGNIGTVYSGDSWVEARDTWREYVRQSLDGEGRAAGEEITLFEKDEIRVQLTERRKARWRYRTISEQ